MRVQASVVSLSWIPTDSLRGPLKTGMDLRLSHWDDPLPDRVKIPEEEHEVRRRERLRFPNVLTAWADVEGGQIVAAGLDPTRADLTGPPHHPVDNIGATFRAVTLPVI